MRGRREWQHTEGMKAVISLAAMGYMAQALGEAKQLEANIKTGFLILG